MGINVTLRPAEVQVALEGYRSGTQAFAYWFWGPDFIDMADFLAFLPGGKVGGQRANWTVENADPAMVALIDQAKVEIDQAKRVDLYGQLQKMAQQDSAFAPFNQPDVLAAWRVGLQGYVWHPVWILDVALLSESG